MKLEDVRQLWLLSRRRVDAAAEELARADARHQAAEQALARQRQTMTSELERGFRPDLWAGLTCWHGAAERQLHDLQAEAGQLAGEAAVARDALGAAAKEAERYRTVTVELAAERRAETTKRVQQELDEAVMRRRHGAGTIRS